MTGLPYSVVAEISRMLIHVPPLARFTSDDLPLWHNFPHMSPYRFVQLSSLPTTLPMCIDILSDDVVEIIEIVEVIEVVEIAELIEID